MNGASSLAAMEISVLVCGAISQALHQCLVNQGILVIPFRTRYLKDIKAAWFKGKLDGDKYWTLGRCRPSVFPCPKGGRNRSRNGSGKTRRPQSCQETGAGTTDAIPHS